MGTFEQIGFQQIFRDGGTVAQDVYTVRCRRDSFREYSFAKQRIDEARLPRIELACDHQQEQPSELVARLLKVPEILRGDI
jgi:hypothetical protein